VSPGKTMKERQMNHQRILRAATKALGPNIVCLEGIGSPPGEWADATGAIFDAIGYHAEDKGLNNGFNSCARRLRILVESEYRTVNEPQQIASLLVVAKLCPQLERMQCGAMFWICMRPRVLGVRAVIRLCRREVLQIVN
jgi:hypothetical protein